MLDVRRICGGKYAVRVSAIPLIPGIQVWAEDVIKVAGQETSLLMPVRHREAWPGTAAMGTGAQDAAAQAVDGAGAHPGGSPGYPAAVARAMKRCRSSRAAGRE